MTIQPLSRLLYDAPPTQAVSWRGEKVLSLARFRGDVAGVAKTYADCPAAILYCVDSYHFAVGLFGLLYAGAKVILPPTGQTDTLASLQGEFSTRIDDAAVANAAPADDILPALDAERPAIVFFTSGSTGAPKKIVKSLAMFEREVALLERCFGAEAGSGRVFATVPHQHMYGLPFKILWSLATGRAFSATTDIFWEPLLAALAAGDVLVSSPAHLGRLSGLPALVPENRPRLVLSAGAPLSKVASDEAESILGRRPTEIFGSTETGAMATRFQRLTDNDPWTLLPDITIRCDEDGRMKVHTPVVGGDWIAMGDVVRPTATGFVYRGRADRIVKVEGKRINLIAVEESLQRLPQIIAAAVVPLDAPLRLAAAVVISEDGKQELETLGAFRFGRLLRRALGRVIDPAGLPRQWRFVDSLGTHPMGKRRDADIAALFSEDA